MDAEISTRPSVFLTPGRDKRIRSGHPWIYSNEVRMDAEAKALPPGTLVIIKRVDGKPMGIASFNPHTLIAARLWDRDFNAPVDAGFLARRLERALAIRERLFDDPSYRLVHAEADGFPGFVIDRFGDALSVQVNTAGAELLLDEMMTAINDVVKPKTVVIRADSAARKQENLESHVTVVQGALSGPVGGAEGELKFNADLEGGQKTGWFFDQRDNRAFAAKFADGCDVLDMYCYGGGFGVSAALNGATSVIGIDRSQPALQLAAETAERSGVAAKCTWHASDAYAALEGFASEKSRFGLVTVDPPAFVKSKKDMKVGLRGYRKLARLAADVVSAQGYMFIASCSHNASPEDFLNEVGRGIASAGRTARLLRSSGAGPDHPIHPQLPESAYLKGLFFALD